MSSVYLVINKLEDESWDDWIERISLGQKLTITPNWRFRHPRSAMDKMAKKGYFIAYTQYGMSVYTRTSKPWVQGDSPKKPLNYSKQNNE